MLCYGRHTAVRASLNAGMADCPIDQKMLRWLLSHAECRDFDTRTRLRRSLNEERLVKMRASSSSGRVANVISLS